MHIGIGSKIHVLLVFKIAICTLNNRIGVKVGSTFLLFSDGVKKIVSKMVGSKLLWSNKILTFKPPV